MKHSVHTDLAAFPALAIGLIIGLAAWPPDGRAATIFVSGTGDDAQNGLTWQTAKRTIAAGLNAAAAGDQVWVGAGTYVGGITLKIEVALYGGFAGNEDPATFDLADRDLVANQTTLDGNQAGRVVTAPPGATTTCRIDGFRITNGTGSGGGLFAGNSSPVIANNVIVWNRGTQGGGLYLYYSSAVIANNTIRDNSASIQGGGLYLLSSWPTIVNNVIAANSGLQGGGLHLNSSSPTMANNTIVSNLAADGGGLYITNYSLPFLANTIVAFNSSGFYAAGGVSLLHCCVYGNTAYDYYNMADPQGTDGNIAADPLFADVAYGNVHLQPNSPCVGAGFNPDAYYVDMDGQPRIQPEAGTVDIGADESDGTLWPAGPDLIVRISPEGDDLNDGSSWALAKRTVQAGITAAAGVGGEVWVQAGTYQQCITLRAYTYLYGGFAGNEAMWAERDVQQNLTILDGQQQGSVVSSCTGHRVSAIDGFTITNGSAARGGGVLSDKSSPTIANNRISGNSATSEGGGLHLECSWALITGNAITGNSAGMHRGGGVHMTESAPTIVNNQITENSAPYGGAVNLYYSAPIIVNNTIAGNVATQWGGGITGEGTMVPLIGSNRITGNQAGRCGGGIYVGWDSGTIANNLIAGNSSPAGGGLYLWDCWPTIVNNTIVGNDALTGGGVHLQGAYPTIANTLVAFNSSGLWADADQFITLRYNCVFGNEAYNYSGLADRTGVDGNVSADPLFAEPPAPGPDGVWGTEDDVPGDVHLLADSPCIEAGENAEAAGEHDLDGRARVIDGDGDLLATIDMGAYEYNPGDGDYDDDGDVDFDDFNAVAGCLTGPGVSYAPACISGNLDCDGDVDLADFAGFQALFGEE